MRGRTGIAVLAALGVAILVGLGVWQLERRAWKHDLIRDIEAGLAAPPTDLASPPSADLAWRAARVEGTWATDAPVRIGPRPRDGEVGADYAAAFRLADGGGLVVRLGWAPADAAAPKLAVGAKTLAGVLIPAPETNLFTPENRPPDQWLWLEPHAIAGAAGLDPAATSPLVLNLDAPPAGLAAIPARPDLPDDHLQYALTWFSLALALAVVAALSLRRRSRS